MQQFNCTTERLIRLFSLCDTSIVILHSFYGSIYEILLKVLHGSGKIFLCLCHSVPLRGRGRAQNRKDANIAASFPWVGFTAHTLAGGDV